MKHSIITLVTFACCVLVAAGCGSRHSDAFAELTPYTLSLHLKYEHIAPFQGDLAEVSMSDPNDPGNSLYGCIDREGREVVPCIYDRVYVHEGSVIAYPNTDDSDVPNQLFVYRDGEISRVPIPEGYKPWGGLYDGLCEVTGFDDEGDWSSGYVNDKGEVVIPCRYKSAGDFSEGLACVEDKDGSWYYINTQGQQVSRKYDWLGSGHEYSLQRGRARVRREVGDGWLYGFIDETGAEVVPCQYDEVGLYWSCGLAEVKRDGLYGLIDRDGNVVVPIEYKHMNICSLHLLAYSDGGGYMGLMHLEGLEPIGLPRYGDVEYIGDGFVRVGQNGKIGFVDGEDGHELVPPIYDRVYHPYGGYLRVLRGNMVGYIDREGREVLMLPDSGFLLNIYHSGFGVFVYRDKQGNIFLFGHDGERLDDNGLPTPTLAQMPGGRGRSGGGSGGGGIATPAPALPPMPSGGSGTSDPARRAEWEMRRSRAIDELTRLQIKLAADPNSAALKQQIRSQQNIINTCNEMIAIYQ